MLFDRFDSVAIAIAASSVVFLMALAILLAEAIWVRRATHKAPVDLEPTRDDGVD